MSSAMRSGEAVSAARSDIENSSTSPASRCRLGFAGRPLTRMSPCLALCATADREAPERTATRTSVRLPACSVVTTCNKAREQEQPDADGNARISNVEDVRPYPVKIDKVDHVSVVNAIDDIADGPPHDHSESNAHDQRSSGGVAEAEPKEHEHDDRHRDEQIRIIPEEPERSVDVSFVRPLQEVRYKIPAFAGQERLCDQDLRILIGPEHRNRDGRDGEDIGDVRDSVAGQTDRTIRRR